MYAHVGVYLRIQPQHMHLFQSQCCRLMQTAVPYCGAVRFSALQSVTVCCRVLQCAAVRCNVLLGWVHTQMSTCVSNRSTCTSFRASVAACCSELQWVAVCCSELQCVAVRRSVLQRMYTCRCLPVYPAAPCAVLSQHPDPVYHNQAKRHSKMALTHPLTSHTHLLRWPREPSRVMQVLKVLHRKLQVRARRVGQRANGNEMSARAVGWQLRIRGHARRETWDSQQSARFLIHCLKWI